MNEKRKYALSDLALIFPDMRGDEFASFKDDIEETGQREPIYIFDDKVIDGRHKLRACEELNIEPWYEVLPDDIDPGRFVKSKNLMRRNLSQSQKALVIVRLTGRPKRGRPPKDSGNSAKLPDFAPLDRKEVAAEAAVALRLINDAAALVDPGTTAIPELVEAVRQGVVSARDARLVLGETAAVQQLGLSLKAIGQVRSLKKGVERARLEIAERGRHKQDRPEQLTIISGRTTLHQLDLAGLRDWVAPATVDVIIAVPPDDPSPSWFSDLVDLTVHALTEEGVLVVPAGVELMKEAITRLEHKALRWVCNIALQFPAAVCRLGEPHGLEITQLPLLVYGKPGYRLGGGPDVIAVPHLDAQWGSWRHALEAAMEPVVSRFATTGQVVLNPMFNGLSGTGRAALKIGCTYIGADADESRLETLASALDAPDPPAPPPPGIAVNGATDAPSGAGDGSTLPGLEAGDAALEASAGVVDAAGQDGPESGEVTSSHAADDVGPSPSDPGVGFLDGETSPEDGEGSSSWPESGDTATGGSTADAHTPSPQDPEFAGTMSDDGDHDSHTHLSRPEAGVGRGADITGEGKGFSRTEGETAESVSASPCDGNARFPSGPVEADAETEEFEDASGTSPSNGEMVDGAVANPSSGTGGTSLPEPEADNGMTGEASDSSSSRVRTIDGATEDSIGEADGARASISPLQGELL